MSLRALTSQLQKPAGNRFGSGSDLVNGGDMLQFEGKLDLTKAGVSERSRISRRCR
jgi:hypothetical protein